MANEADVAAAWLAICAADTGAGSLVALTGRADPMRSWGDAGDASLPVLALPVPLSAPTGRTPYTRSLTARPEVRATRESQKLAWQILDRLELITTWSAFDAQGLDIQVIPGVRAPEESGGPDGYRVIATYTLNLTV